MRGFSLVELSIVLVILGLLTGGILAGQSLIRASELRSLTTQEQAYVAAVGSFRDKYFQLPGDMNNAFSFWGTSCATTSALCNGNGDGLVAYPLPTNTDWEFFMAWKHLALAGLVEGNYTGASGGGGGSTIEHLPGTNCPATKMSSSACWQMRGWGSGVTGSGVVFDGSYGNALNVGMKLATQQPLNPLLKTEEAWNIDTKMDDGKPGTGSVTSSKGTSAYSGGCASGDTSAATYVLTTTTVTCILYFKTGY